MPDTVKRYTFRKPEKICNQNQIDRIFKDGKSLISGQFRLIYLESELSNKPTVQVLIAVPKKSLRHAVTRNHMKRLIRETYRMNKHTIIEHYSSIAKHCDIAIVFNGKQCVSLEETILAINTLLVRLIKIHEKNSE